MSRSDLIFKLTDLAYDVLSTTSTSVSDDDGSDGSESSDASTVKNVVLTAKKTEPEEVQPLTVKTRIQLVEARVGSPMEPIKDAPIKDEVVGGKKRFPSSRTELIEKLKDKTDDERGLSKDEQDAYSDCSDSCSCLSCDSYTDCSCCGDDVSYSSMSSAETVINGNGHAGKV